MDVSTSIEVSYKHVDGWHIFQSREMPGFYVSNRDPKVAFESIGPTIEKLVELDTGVSCKAFADVPLQQFISTARAEIAGQHSQRFTLLKHAA